MARTVQIGNRRVGEGEPCFIAAEIGINHNGDVALAKQLIDVAARFGADAVKFQKRTVEVVYAPEELARPRENPFGPTNGDLKRGLELDEAAYREIDAHCRERGVLWYASCWDEGSVDFIERFNPPCYKIASASLTDDNLLRHTRAQGKPVILSTGMSTMEEITHAVGVLGREDLVILHCTSTYPSQDRELNLKLIEGLQRRFPECPIGYSGHEIGVMPSVVAAAMGACMVERHITVNRALWGSDQAASLEPHGLELLVKYIRAIPEVMGDGEKVVYEREQPILRKLRRVKSPASPAV